MLTWRKCITTSACKRAAQFLAVASFGGLALAQQGYPAKSVRIVVPFPAGGPIDMTTRPLAQKLTEGLGGPVVVDNRGGANGNIGAENVAKSPPDEIGRAHV